MLEKSALANDLKEVFHCLKDGGGLNVKINGWILLRQPQRHLVKKKNHDLYAFSIFQSI